MKDERMWHGIRFIVDAYYEFHHSIDQCIQIDITSREVVDEDECLLWAHGIPKTQADWDAVEREATPDIIAQIDEDISIAEQERQVERMLIERDLQRYDY